MSSALQHGIKSGRAVPQGLHLSAAPRAISHVKKGSWCRALYSFIWCFNGLRTPAVGPVTARYWVSVIIRSLIVNWGPMKRAGSPPADGSVTGGMVASTGVSCTAVRTHAPPLRAKDPAENRDTAIYGPAQTTGEWASSFSWLKHFLREVKGPRAVDWIIWAIAVSVTKTGHLLFEYVGHIKNVNEQNQIPSINYFISNYAKNNFTFWLYPQFLNIVFFSILQAGPVSVLPVDSDRPWPWWTPSPGRRSCALPRRAATGSETGPSEGRAGWCAPGACTCASTEE